ncbi:MAG: hypothetical protein KA218_04600 [Arenimonas sp.]|nr:hypothetical protein [Arenimonas sp.]MBP7981454.1 hypothetical protein [Arenimonas sp.]
MAGEVFIVLIVFSALVLIVRAAVDGIIRAKALKSDVASAEVIKALSQAGTPFHLTALKWGLGLGSLGVGFLIIEALKLQPEQPGTWGVLTLSVAAGLLAFYAFAKRQLK